MSAGILLAWFLFLQQTDGCCGKREGWILGIDRAAPRTLLYCIIVFLLSLKRGQRVLPCVLGFRSGKRIANMLAVCPAGICHGGAESARDTLLQHFQLISERSHMGWI